MGEPLVHPNGKDKEMTEEVIHDIGTLLEVTEDSDLESWGQKAYKGLRFIVEDYAPFNEDPDYLSEVYIGMDSYGSSVEVEKDRVKLVLDADAVRNRKLPDARTVLVEMDFLSGFSDFNFDESDIVEDDTIEVYGETPEGLPFGVQLKVTGIFHVDR